MPDKKSSKNNESEDTGKGGSKKMIISAVLSVALLGAGYFIGGMSSGGDSTPVAEAADGEQSAEDNDEKKELGHLVDLEPINVNLQDGHFLRIAITLDTHTEESGGHGKEEAVFPTAPAADLLLATFSGRDMAELSTETGREEARAELLESLEEAYGEEVTGVFLTEFVMQ